MPGKLQSSKFSDVRNCDGDDDDNNNNNNKAIKKSGDQVQQNVESKDKNCQL
jgi:hypothetical protein